MSEHIKNEKNLPITYSINIKTLSTSKRPLTCYISATPRIKNQLNYLKPSKCLENKQQSLIHLPITYSTSIHVPCHPPVITQRSPEIFSSQSSYHHYHHYHHHHYYHHYRQPSTAIKNKISPRPTSIASTRPATTSTTTFTSPESSSLPSKKINKNIPASPSPNKQVSPPPPPPPFPSYSALVWNWFHHTSTKSQSHHKGSQSDYSEVCRNENPNKRNLFFKLLTSPTENQSKSKHHRTCFTRKRFESSSSLPTKSNHYNE